MRPPTKRCRCLLAAVLVLGVLPCEDASARGGYGFPDPFGWFGQPRRLPIRHRRPALRQKAREQADQQDASGKPTPPLPPERPAEFAAPKDVPLPPERPADLSAKDEPSQTSDEPAVPTAPMLDATGKPREMPLPPERPTELTPREVPLPPERPGDVPGAASERVEGAAPPDAPLPPSRPPDLSGDKAQAMPEAPPDDAACLARLDALGVTYKTMPPIVNGQCSVPNPIDVSAVSGIPLKPAVTLVCGVTEPLAKWTAQVKDAADKELGDSLKALSVGGGYECRGMNHGADAKLSEHAFANAIDVMGFTFGKHAPILVHAVDGDAPEAKFLIAIRARACPLFKTVLGPGANEAHANHFHLDDRQRSASYRICE